MGLGQHDERDDADGLPMAEPPFDCAQGRLDETQAGKLYDFNARFFTPACPERSRRVAARFISPDSIVPNPADPQSLNRYTAMANNPLKFTDPTGHDLAGSQNNCNFDDDTLSVDDTVAHFRQMGFSENSISHVFAAADLTYAGPGPNQGPR